MNKSFLNLISFLSSLFSLLSLLLLLKISTLLLCNFSLESNSPVQILTHADPSSFFFYADPFLPTTQNASLSLPTPQISTTQGELSHLLRMLKEKGKKIFLLTNSPFYFVDGGMHFKLEDSLGTQDSWRELFDVVIAKANKTEFYTSEHPFRGAFYQRAGCPLRSQVPCGIPQVT